MVQIKLKGVIGVESPSPRSFWCGQCARVASPWHERRLQEHTCTINTVSEAMEDEGSPPWPVVRLMPERLLRVWCLRVSQAWGLRDSHSPHHTPLSTGRPPPLSLRHLTCINWDLIHKLLFSHLTPCAPKSTVPYFSGRRQNLPHHIWFCMEKQV